ncbi:TIGR01741 family protein [Staphylococcus aureus]|uniref:TIGR01741 family protein n=1 Tax=Staphylococcus aureus TaxID=1280 RepID=UPI0035FEBF90
MTFEEKLNEMYNEIANEISGMIPVEWEKVYTIAYVNDSAFKEEDLEPWTSCEFDFTRDGKLNVSFDYIDWMNSEFGPMGREDYYMYKKFGIWPEKEYAINRVKKIEDYIKEQEETEL